MSRVYASARLETVTADFSFDSGDSNVARLAAAIDGVDTGFDAHLPPRKKRRLNNVKLENPEERDASFCVADVRLRLRCGDEVISHTPPPEESDFHSVREVDVLRVGLAQEVDQDPTWQRFYLVVAPQASKLPKTQITLVCEQDDGDYMAEHLQTAARLRSYEPCSAKWKPGNAAFVDSSMVFHAENGSVIAAELRVRIMWRADIYAPGSNVRGKDMAKRSWSVEDLLESYIRTGAPKSYHDYSAQDFYAAVHTPDPSKEANLVPLKELKSHLFPFQRRTVEWLLRREGMEPKEGEHIVPTTKKLTGPPISYHEAKDALGNDFYVSHLLHGATKATNDFPSLLKLKGGILAEEMGLGKTLELLALVCAHPRSFVIPEQQNNTISSSAQSSELQQSRATLIICPTHILHQWESEIAIHTPTLNVHTYLGLKQSKFQSDSEGTAHILQQDIVLTTYNVLRAEIHYAEEGPDRALRNSKKYARRRSPLTELEWWRVCLDEAQMIESGVSNAAIVARLIPRVNAWAVSGTPMRRTLDDLRGLLLFLHLDPFCDQKVFNRMTQYYPEIFSQLFGDITLRHAKRQISQELRIPAQRRVTVSLPFTSVEEQHYKNLFDQMCNACGFTAEGGPANPNNDHWNPESAETIAKMRQWLSRLRQTCLHPEIGDRNRADLRRGRRQGPLRTVNEVLQLMIEQNETALRNEERNALVAEIVRGHVVYFGKDYKTSLQIYLEALRKSSAAVQECRVDVQQVQTTVSTNKETIDEVDDEKDEGELDETRELILRYKSRLRNALELEHMCHFFAATAYYQIKINPDFTEEGSEAFQELETKESESYEKAKIIRKEMLSDAYERCQRLMRRIQSRNLHSTEVIPKLTELSQNEGLESRRYGEAFDNIAKIINDQGDLLLEWREKMIELLRSRLLDQEDNIELTGEEYEQSTKLQDEQYVYLALLRTALTDREFYFNGVYNRLIEYENKTALKQAKENQGHAPELLITSLAKRAELELAPNPETSNTLRNIMAEVRAALTNARAQEVRGATRSHWEAEILETQLASLHQIFTTQNKTLVALQKDLELFRTTMNARVEFHRQLQQISDTVAPYQEETSDAVDQKRVEEQLAKEKQHTDSLAGYLTKRRFLQHLKAENAGEDISRECIICRSSFELGVLTSCGHMYCKDCIMMWFREHRNCPACKRNLRSTDFHDITYKPRQAQLQEEDSSQSQTNVAGESAAPEASIATRLDEKTMSEINQFDLDRSYGSKLDTLVRHLKWIQAFDKGAKSVIFSQYSDYLDLLSTALRHFGIQFRDVRAKNGITEFRLQPEVACFLLHAQANSSGLNLVNASHVFICEPLVNAALELQATARVHRIGQMRETTVWTYIVGNTVEESVHEISVSRRLELLRRLKPVSSGTTTPLVADTEAVDQVDALEMQRAPTSELLSKGGAEIVRAGDLWDCLFSRSGYGQKTAGNTSNGLSAVIAREMRANAAENRAVATGS